MRRGQGLPLNTIAIAIVVILVLVLVVLIFVSHASSFQSSASSNRCDGPTCQLIQNAGLADVSVTGPQSVVEGQPASFTVNDAKDRFSSVSVEIVSSPATGKVTQPAPRGGPAGSVHRVSFNATDAPGVYEYRLVGTTPDGRRVVIRTGSFTVVAPTPSGKAQATIELPATVSPEGPLIVAAQPNGAYASGSLVFASNEHRFSVKLSKASGGTLAGRLEEPMPVGTYALDTKDSSLTDAAGSAHGLDPSISARLVVTSAIACSSSSSCDSQAPYCAYNGTSFACSASCVGVGGLATDANACCSELRYNGTSRQCELAARPLRIVLVPVGIEPARLTGMANAWKRALVAASPLRSCGPSRLSISTVSDASCAASCPLASSMDPITEAQWSSCLDTIEACARKLVPDADRVVGVVGVPSVSIDEPSGSEVSFTARSEVGGSRLVVRGQGGNLTRTFLEAFGMSYGLGPLACGTNASQPRTACAGPNHLDCGPRCTLPFDPTNTAVDWNATCFSNDTYSARFVMSSCPNASVFGPAGSSMLAADPGFERAMEGCS